MLKFLRLTSKNDLGFLSQLFKKEESKQAPLKLQ